MTAGQFQKCSPKATFGNLCLRGTEATFEEFHPSGTRYDSPQAPVAPTFFPYNRCDVFACSHCGCGVLKYTEYGGYYVDHRVRLVNPDLVVTGST